MFGVAREVKSGVEKRQREREGVVGQVSIVNNRAICVAGKVGEVKLR